MLVVERTRGGHPEARHPFSAVLAGPDGVSWATGPDLETFWRSGSKPFQLLNSLTCLPPRVVDELDPLDLAIGASSHSGQPFHVERVAALLDRFGLDPAELRCGAHWPLHEPSARRLAAAGQTCSNLHSNCSGKHSFMLAACAARGWDRDYRPLHHPLQQGNHQLLREWMEHDSGTGVDGCSIPTFYAPISAMARAFARLARSMVEQPDGIPGRIGWAMHHHPDFTSGEDRLDRQVVRLAAAPLTVKVGAEGLFCIALPREGLGMVVKVHTGNSDALATAVHHVLNDRFPGLLPDDWSGNVLYNVAGLEVGAQQVVADARRRRVQPPAASRSM